MNNAAIQLIIAQATIAAGTAIREERALRTPAKDGDPVTVCAGTQKRKGFRIPTPTELERSR